MRNQQLTKPPSAMSFPACDENANRLRDLRQEVTAVLTTTHHVIAQSLGDLPLAQQNQFELLATAYLNSVALVTRSWSFFASSLESSLNTLIHWMTFRSSRHISAQLRNPVEMNVEGKQQNVVVQGQRGNCQVGYRNSVAAGAETGSDYAGVIPYPPVHFYVGKAIQSGGEFPFLLPAADALQQFCHHDAAQKNASRAQDHSHFVSIRGFNAPQEVDPDTGIHQNIAQCLALVEGLWRRSPLCREFPARLGLRAVAVSFDAREFDLDNASNPDFESNPESSESSLSSSASQSGLTLMRPSRARTSCELRAATYSLRASRTRAERESACDSLFACFTSSPSRMIVVRITP